MSEPYRSGPPCSRCEILAEELEIMKKDNASLKKANAIYKNSLAKQLGKAAKPFGIAALIIVLSCAAGYGVSLLTRTDVQQTADSEGNLAFYIDAVSNKQALVEAGLKCPNGYTVIDDDDSLNGNLFIACKTKGITTKQAKGTASER